jgi:hypothetical protein
VTLVHTQKQKIKRLALHVCRERTKVQAVSLLAQCVPLANTRVPVLVIATTAHLESLHLNLANTRVLNARPENIKIPPLKRVA